MASQLWTTNALAVAFGHTHRTMSARLADLPPDAEKIDEAGRPIRRWRLARVIEHLQHRKDGKNDLDAERARLAKEQADAQEIKNALLREEVISAEEATAALGKVASAIVQILESIPTRLKRAVPALTQSDLDIVRAEIVRARNEAADYRSGH